MQNAHSPKFSSADNSKIDLMVNFDFIADEEYSPHTTAPWDDPYGLYARAFAGEFGPIAAYVAPVVVEPVPDSISRHQCAKQLFDMGMITAEEAVAMAKTSTEPAMIAAVFNGISDPVARAKARIDFASDRYLRNNQLLNSALGAPVSAGGLGYSQSDIDDFFRAAGKQ